MEVGKNYSPPQGRKLNKHKPESYRPIAILPAISKLAERAVQKQLINFMEDSKQMNLNSHAYKQLHSTTTALLQISDFLADSANMNKISNLMILDQSAAFDCVDKIILDQKMKIYNFSEKTRGWFRDFLSDRSHYVMIGAHSSTMKSVKWGVPQGSVLGPALYLMYTNEMSESTKDNVNCRNLSHRNRNRLFGENCETAGSSQISQMTQPWR